jgi:hypothetical protein
MAITKPVPGTINAPLGSQQESGVNAFGGLNILKIQGVSSDVVLADVNLATVTGGDVMIENCILETDVTGFAGGTNVQIGSDDPIGLENFFIETVANLGANKTVDFSSASVAKQKAVIRNGFHLTIDCTVAPCTGAGVWILYVLYRPCVQVALLQ